MHHYCVIWSKTEPAATGLACRLEQFVHRRLVFEPDEVVLHRIGALLRAEVERMSAAGVVNVDKRFYIEHVMSNWGNSQLRGSSNHAIAGLLDIGLARLMHTRQDMDDELPYEIVARCAPELLPFPFAGDRWAGRTLARAEADGVARAGRRATSRGSTRSTATGATP